MCSAVQNTERRNTDVCRAVQDTDGTISPATIYQHYGRVARRLFRALDADPPASTKTRQVVQVTAARALDWPPSVTTKTLDELPISPNSSLPEYQLTQEWFEQVVRELSEAEESRAVMAAASSDSGGGGGDIGADAEVAGHERL